MNIKNLMGKSIGDVAKVLESMHAYLESIDEKLGKLIELQEKKDESNHEPDSEHSAADRDNTVS